MSKSRLVSGRVKKLTGAALDPNRSSYLDVGNAEPDLGLPSINGQVLVSTTAGARSWSTVTSLTGSVGFTGSQGYTGSRGAGFTGSLGFTGSRGYTGSAGSNGFTGSTGYSGSKGESSFTYGATAPVNPTVGDRWLDSLTGAELVWTNDGDTTQWVEVSASGFLGRQGYTGSLGGSGYTGSEGPAGTSVNIVGQVSTSAGLDPAYTGNQGDGFIAQDTGNLWVWSGSAWNNVGRILGYTGSKGDTGFTGSQGIPGEYAAIGFTGSTGYTGSRGIPGEAAAIGYTGSVGYAGSVGFTGSQGVPGEYAALGYTGSIGYTGSQGVPGEYAALGYTGSQGDLGYTGSSGAYAALGFTGSRGESSFTYSDNPPLNPTAGDRWYDSSLGFEFVWTDDGNSVQWVEITTSGKGYTGSASFELGPIGYTGSSGAYAAIGFTGSQGPIGDIGYTGSKGDIGYTGSRGIHSTVLVVAVTDEIYAITVGTPVTFRMPFPVTLAAIPRASLTTASTSGNLVMDLRLNGVSVLGVNKLSIDANEKTSVTAATPTTLATTAIPDDGEISFAITSAGTGAKGLKVIIYYTV